METFGEALQKLREVYECEVGGWQDKILALTNQKNADAIRIEELYNKNQQLREQQRSLTENIKQLENRLRAGLCDRCTVTQDVASRRQQEYETSQLQSLHLISAQAKEIGTLRRENKRLSEEIKSQQAALRNPHGYSIETASQKSAALPAGGTVQKSDPRLNGPNMTEESRPIDRVNQQESYELNRSNSPILSHPSPLRAAWKTVQNIGRDRPALERRARSVDTQDPHSMFPQSSMLMMKNNLYSSSTTGSAAKWGPSRVHTPVPLRPQPIKNPKFVQSWHMPDNPDWVTMSIMSDDGTVIHHTPNMVQQPAKPHNSNQSAQERLPNTQSHWTNTQSSAVQRSPGLQINLNEEVEPDQNPEGTVRPGLTSVSEPNQNWETVDAKDRTTVEAVDNDCPLDLSDAGRAKAVKTPQEAPNSMFSPVDSPFSTSSSSVAAPSSSSSSVASSVSQSEQRLGEVVWQDGAEEGVQNNKAGETMDLSIGTDKSQMSVYARSLQPVVLLENMKRSLPGQNHSDSLEISLEEEKEEGEYKEENGEQSNQSRKRVRLELETDTNSQLSGHMETRTRLGGRPKGKSPAEQG